MENLYPSWMCTIKPKPLPWLCGMVVFEKAVFSNPVGDQSNLNPFKNSYMGIELYAFIIGVYSR